jgi:hypothetical protein
MDVCCGRHVVDKREDVCILGMKHGKNIIFIFKGWIPFVAVRNENK